VEGLIAQRKQHLQQLDDLLKSVFLEMFGDPVRNEKGWPERELGSAFKVKHGFAFSSDFFRGKGPFVLLTPGNFYEEGGFKDRGVRQKFYVGEAPDEYVLRAGSLLLAMTEQAPGLLGSPLVVPDSGLYLHNQRLGLIVEKEPIQLLFLFHLFNQRSVRQIIHSKATGTKVRHTSPTKIEAISVGYPPIFLQNQFAAIVEKVEALKTCFQKSLTDLESLYGLLSQRAFKGELDLSRVALLAVPIKGEMPVYASAPAPITAPVIELPETDLLLPALQDRTQLAPLLRFWLDAYFTQLGSAAFSLERFIAAAQTRLGELHPDHDFALGASDYEAIKAWVFDQIKNRKLKQTRDIIFIDGRRQFGNQIMLRARRHAQQ
jgi:type I restriction enzyme S subunit